MPQFDTSTYTSQLFWLAVCWGVLFVYLWLYLVPKMQAKISSRDQKIDVLLKKAKLLDESAEQLMLDYKEKKDLYKQTQVNKVQQMQSFIDQSRLELEAEFKLKLDEAIKNLEVKLKAEHSKTMKQFPKEISAVLAQFATQYGLEANDVNALLEKHISKEMKGLLQ